MSDKNGAWKIWVDTGGTFTDCIGLDPDGNVHTAKVLSNSSLRGEITAQLGNRRFKINHQWDVPDDFIRGFRLNLLMSGEYAEVLSFHSGESIIELNREIEPVAALPTSFEVLSDEEAPVLAARLLTKTKKEEDLPHIQLRLATTLGTNALLERKGEAPLLCITKGFEDLLEIGNQQRRDLFALEIKKKPLLCKQVLGISERIDADGKILEEFDVKSLQQVAAEIRNDGVKSAAVVLMNSPKNGVHEQQIKEVLRKAGFIHVSVSGDLSNSIKFLPRAETTVVNAYLAPVLIKYLESIKKSVSKGSIHIMTSAGGLSSVDQFLPKESLLSGPAGGVVGAVSASISEGFDHVISFDMGGTSTDVARYSGSFDYVFEHSVGDAHLVSPAVNVETVAAGGGSLCYFDGYKLCVGPESAGAFPGPACYGAGGPLTVTDVNVLLGRLDSVNFQIPISKSAAEIKLTEILRELEAAIGEKQNREEILAGFLAIANEKMAEAIRKISVKKGHDTSGYLLTAFGGAGGQHACAIAKLLTIKKVLIPPLAGLLSAFGLGKAKPEEFSSMQILKPFEKVQNNIDTWIDELSESASQRLLNSFKTVAEVVRVSRKILSLRFQGQETTIEIDYDESGNILSSFKEHYSERFGHWIEDRTIELESIRVTVVLDSDTAVVRKKSFDNGEKSDSTVKPVWFDGGHQECKIIHVHNLKTNDKIDGPIIIMDPYSTIVVEPGWQAVKKDSGALLLSMQTLSETEGTFEANDAVQLELFTNRFTAIADQMGEILRRTAISVNVKDRLDFSCALLSLDGELIVNAPHIPVHLGAMGRCIQAVIKEIKMGPGDVVVTNHPAFGGSHLPDVTVITPVYFENELIAFAANRAHHAEIGGKAPGSMPPDAKNLEEEGIIIPPSYVIKNGTEKWKEIENLFLGGTYPSRSSRENLADLRAAVAANQYGVKALKNLAEQYGLKAVREYMQKIRGHSALKMSELIKKLPNGSYQSEEFLDNGTPLRATITVTNKAITFDFTGTGPVQPGNLNATPAIVHSVVMYILRVLIDEDVPLNDGLFDAVKIVLPECLLNPVFPENPAECPALVGGNTEISQRLTDTLLKPFGRIACSQGTMNNVLFGNDSFGYYETVGGGTGAGVKFNGADAVHHHMTNTRGTDPEIFEHNYPVRLNEYSIRRESGGDGKFRGGDGIIRDITFLEPVYLSVLTQHRVQKPYGLKGGDSGAQGEQFVIRKNGEIEKLSSVDGRYLNRGDRFILHTPGGGGFGKPESDK